MARKTKKSSAAPCRSDLLEKVKAETPNGLPDKPDDKNFKLPVAWLGGRELIANLKLFALHALFGGKLDSRDWMTGVVNVFKDPSKPTPAPAKAQEGEELYTRAVEMEWTGDEFWFDYLADTGDGQMPIYNIAYLCMTDLYLSAKVGDVHFEEQKKDVDFEEKEKSLLLPRGQFLFVGGDTAYHVADYETLAQRFQAPFWWAYLDLVCEEKIPEEEMGKRRPLFGIPANHDYYDALDGFNRQFRRPITGEDDSDKRPPQLQLPTFERQQEASYVALQLPHGWWLWGIDTENDEIDFRQQTFFRKLGGEGGPKKLILATPSPTTVFGKYLSMDSPFAKVFKDIGLGRPFLKAEDQDPPSDHLQTGACRLDLSGDIHHYARYMGPQTESDEAKRPRYKQNGDSVEHLNYASVVTGGGGAFFDPTNTYFGEVKEQAIFPDVRTSLGAFSTEILNYLNILRGGSVHYLGAFMAFVICFAALIVPGSHDLLLKGLIPLPGRLVLSGLLPIIFSILLLVVGHVLLKMVLDRADAKARAVEGRDELRPHRSAVAQTKMVWFLLLLPVPFMLLGLLLLRAHRPLPTFGESLLVFLAGVWAALMSLLYVRYTEPLNERAKKGEVEWWEFWPPRAMLTLAVAAFCSGLWFFGRLSSARHLFAGVVFITVVASVLLGLPCLAVFLGAARHGAKGKAGYFLIGLWHALLQLLVPVLWTLSFYNLFTTGDKRIYFALLIFAERLFWLFGVKSVRDNNRQFLVVLWVGFGLLTIVLPSIYLALLPEGELVRTLMQMSGWERLWLCAGAAIIGAVMSCVWFGWYLAVAMIFNGHNNEAGGAARLVGYKQFMRIRLTEKDLTAYVIGFDDARPEGKDLTGGHNLRLVDQFTLTVK